ncbi:CocE/NonD family hydrolase [Pedobacter sp. UC225_65]|uniref:CocE/NonD family hydrolase n=1 Tax=Pedobacter sp. UC225_65 TaxID=3350173 RepID=UPI00366CCC6A
MRNFLSLAFFCLFFGSCAFAQQANVFVFDRSDYIVQDSILIKTPDGAQVSALVVRKKEVKIPLPTILSFTIYARQTDLKKAKEAADKGYVGVVAYTRGKKNSPDIAVPYEHDGDDVNAVINWICKQTWSNQKVGMYGGSYNGFAQWAATKKLHPALKTIVPSAAAAPGLDVPMTNNVVMSFPFSWTYYVTNNKLLDNDDYNNKQWNDLDDRWYQSGKAYPMLDSLMGRPKNSIFRRWLAHPAYDSYWQSIIPTKQISLKSIFQY